MSQDAGIKTEPLGMIGDGFTDQKPFLSPKRQFLSTEEKRHGSGHFNFRIPAYNN